jgi:GT2 family glycosyltransferase
MDLKNNYMISLIIPTVSKTREYTNSILNNIREIYPNEDEIEVVIEENDDVDLGTNYNNAVAKARGKKIILLHNDMIIKPGFIEILDKHIIKNRITTYTRVEPPIFTDIYPGKVLLDCGYDLNIFNKEKFNQFDIEENLIDGGSQLFFGCLREDYIKLDNITFSPPQMWCSDDDLHLRYKLAGFERKVSSAHAYHFVSKTSRSTNNYQQIEHNSNKNFIRKWGFRQSQSNKKYNIAFVIKNSTFQHLEVLEPWCDRIYLDDEMQVITDNYIQNEQPNTSFDLKKRIFITRYNDPYSENDIILEFDGRNFTQNLYNIIQNLSDIITESGEVGTFELDCFKITINSMETYEKDLIYLKN